MPKLKSVLWISFSVFFFLNTYAQRERDTIKPEKLIIVKQYNPSVNDAFKIKKQPKLGDSILTSPMVLNYSILEVPVASTFTPAKGSAGGLRLRPDNYDSYNSYARLGAGNFTSILAEFFTEVKVSDYQQLNVDLSHFSSQGGIDEVAFDDDFTTNSLQLKFRSEEKSFVWKLHTGLSLNAYNYYGIPEDLLPLLNEDVGDLSQRYFGFNVGGSLAFYDAVFKRVDVDFSTFSDNFDTKENRLQVKPQIDFFIRDQRIENFISVDYLTGELSNASLVDNEAVTNFNYAWLIAAYNPNIQINEDRFSLKLGAEFTYLSDTENQETNFYVYPKLEGSYRIKQDNLIAFGGLDGGLEQNSYQQFSSINPFVAPISGIGPTNTQYDVYLGLKGGSYAWSYSARVSYRAQENNPFFVSRAYDSDIREAFNYNNSFGIVYNDLNTTAFDVEVDYSVSNKFNLGIHANFSSYDVDEMQSAWNLPNTSASLYGSYQVSEKWSLGTSVFYMGERDDIQFSNNFPFGNTEVVSLSSFIDANFSVQYKINEQLHAFVEANNIFGGSYERWLNYPVQDLQVLGGVSFQFDW